MPPIFDVAIGDSPKSKVAELLFSGAAKEHAADLRPYLEARAKIIADGIVQIAADRVAGKITDDDVRFAFEQIKDSEKTVLLAIDVTLRAAAQDAINAALAVVVSASIKLSASPFSDLMHLTVIPSVERWSAEPTNKS